MTVGPPYWVEVLTKGGREIIWTTLPDKQVGYFCLPGLIPVGRYIPITPVLYIVIHCVMFITEYPQYVSIDDFLTLVFSVWGGDNTKINI